MAQIKTGKNSLELVWNGKPEKLVYSASKLEIQEKIPYRSIKRTQALDTCNWSNLLIKGNNLKVIPAQWRFKISLYRSPVFYRSKQTNKQINT